MPQSAPENFQSLQKYRIALKQFLSTSQAPSKANPTRAAKAREKLLKLSSSQFFELSTDVYDELQRRISESQEEPDFLLPMKDFHPKRNEAREKLGSLQQTRFRDLVSDIYFEIERRNEEQKKKDAAAAIAASQAKSPQSTSNERVSTNTVLTDLSGDSNSPVDMRDSLQSKNLGSDGKNKNMVTLQPTTVIPTKADLAWSSDEEDEDTTTVQRATHGTVTTTDSSDGTPYSNVGATPASNITSSPVASSVSATPAGVSMKSPTSSMHPENVLKSPVSRTTASMASSSPYNSSSRTSAGSPAAFRQIPSMTSSESPRLVPTKRQSNSSQLSADAARDTVGELNGFTTSEPRVQRGLSINKHRNKDREIELLIQEGTKMDSKITDLEQKNSLLHSKAEKFEDEVRTLQTIKDNLSNKIVTLEAQLAEKDETIKTLESELASSTTTATSAQRDLRSVSTQAASDDVSDSVWKAKYQQLKDFHTRDTPSIDALSDESLEKYVSPNGVVPTGLVMGLREGIQNYLVEVQKPTHGQGVNSGRLFEHMSIITDFAGKISCRVPPSEKAEMVRASLSHAITSTRYYSLYGELLPKLIIESAVCHVAFSVFELVQDVRLVRSDGSGPVDRDITLSGQRPKPAFESSTTSDVSPVRPLRMTKKSEGGSTASTPRSVSTPRPLNLTINSQLANSTTGFEKKQLALSSRDTSMSSKSTSTPATTTEPPAQTSPLTSRYPHNSNNKSGVDAAQPSPQASPVTSRYPHNSSNKSGVDAAQLSPQASPVTSRYPLESSNNSNVDASQPSGLRKSSSSNILSKVKQFEHQTEVTPQSSPNSKKPVVSPLSENVVGMFGKRRVSETGKVNGHAINAATSTGHASDATEMTRTTAAAATSTATAASGTGNVTSKLSSESKPIVVTKSRVHAAEIPVVNGLEKATHVTRAMGSGFSTSTKTEQDMKADQVESTPVHDVISPSSESPEISPVAPLKRATSLNRKQGTESRVANGEAKNDQLHDTIVNSLSNETTASAAVQSETLPLGITRSVEQESTFPSKTTAVNAAVDVTAQTGNNQVTKGSDDSVSAVNGTTKLSSEKALVGPGEKINAATLPAQSKSLQKEPDVRPSPESEVSESPETERQAFDEENFDVDDFDIDDPDNTLSELLLYLEHQTVKVISTIQTFLTAIKTADSTKGELRAGSKAISDVVSQMVDATSNSMNQSRNAQLKEHGTWVVNSLADSRRRMNILCQKTDDVDDDDEYADKQFKQRLAGIAFDVAKSTKELVKSVEEANLKEEIAHLNAKLVR